MDPVFRQQRPTHVDKRVSRFNVEIHAGRVAVSMRGIVGGVVRVRDPVTELKSRKFFPALYFDDLRKFILAKVSHYTVAVELYFRLEKMHL